MPTNPSQRLGLVAPIGNESLRDGDDRMRNMVVQMEAVVPSFNIGTGALPAAGIGGRFLFMSDVGIMYFDNGSRWRVVGGHTGQLSFTTRITAPPGFLICIGQSVTSQFPELRAVLVQQGSPFGVDGSGNPKLPTSQGRVLMAGGPATAFTSDRTSIGEKPGDETVTLEPEQMPVHTHNLGQGTSATADQVGGFNPQHLVVNILGQTNRLDFGDTSPSGGGQPHPNVQPSLVLNLMVQT